VFFFVFSKGVLLYYSIFLSSNVVFDGLYIVATFFALIGTK